MYDQRARADLVVAEIAGRQCGVVSVAQLYAAGLDKHSVHHRARTGRLHRVHRGVYAVGHRAVSPHEKWMAAVLASGWASEPAGRGEATGGTHAQGSTISAMAVVDYWGAALSHRSAASLWQLPSPEEEVVDVSVAGYGGRKRRRGIRLHRSQLLLPAVVTLRSGIPVTTPARTISDLRRVVSAPGKRGLISPRELRRAIRQAGVLGLPIGDDEMRDPTRSDLERDFLDLCRRFGLPMPEVNVRIGSHLVDFLWRERKLVVETDGYISHRGRAAFEDDRGRDLELRARGFQVFRLAEKQLDEEPRRVAEVVAAALRVGADAAQPV